MNTCSKAQNLSIYEKIRLPDRRGAAQLRNITEAASKSLFSPVNRCPIRYGFGAGAVLALVRTNRHSTGAYRKHEISDGVLRMPQPCPPPAPASVTAMNKQLICPHFSLCTDLPPLWGEGVVHRLPSFGQLKYCYEKNNTRCSKSALQ